MAERVGYPAVRGGEQTLKELVHEYKTKGPVYRRTVQTTLKASYTHYYRRMIAPAGRAGVPLQQQRLPAGDGAIDVLARYAGPGTTYYPLGERVPRHGGSRGLGGWCTAWSHGDGRVERIPYEVPRSARCATTLRRKEVYVVGAGR